MRTPQRRDGVSGGARAPARARPVPAAANAAIDPTAPSNANIGWRRTIAIATDPNEADDGAGHPPSADHRLGWWRRRHERCDGIGNGATRPAQHRAPPGIARRPTGRDGIGLGRWSGHQQTAGAELDRHVVTDRGRPVDRALTDDDGHSPGELEDRHRAVGADVEHRMVRLDVRIGETDRGARGAPDEVPSRAEADRVPDGGSGDLDNRHQRRSRRVEVATHPGDPVDAAPGPQLRPAERHRRVDLDAVDGHAGRRVDAEGARELADRGRARVRPQLGGPTVGSGHHEARWSTEMHDDLWVDRPPLRKASVARARCCETSGELSGARSSA